MGIDVTTERQAEPAAEGAQGGGGRKPSWRKVLLLTLVGLLVVVVGMGGYAAYLVRKADANLQREALLPGGADQTAPELTFTTEDGKRLVWKERAIIDGEGRNYLVIGSDARPGETSSRSDVIIVAHVDADDSRVDLIHFPRDLYVPIRGHGQDKINAAYAFGGAPLLVTTLQDLVGVQIDHVAKVDFEGFKRLTDAVGGVRVWAEEASSGRGNGGPVVIKKGWNNLDGEGALGFVRERYELSMGDISRGRRQQAFIKALILKTLQPEVIANPFKLNQIVDAATSNTTLDEDFDTSEIIQRAVAMRGVRGNDIHFITAPFAGFGRSPAGASIDILDVPGMKGLSEALRTDDLASFQP